MTTATLEQSMSEKLDSLSQKAVESLSNEELESKIELLQNEISSLKASPAPGTLRDELDELITSNPRMAKLHKRHGEELYNEWADSITRFNIMYWLDDSSFFQKVYLVTNLNESLPNRLFNWNRYKSFINPYHVAFIAALIAAFVNVQYSILGLWIPQWLIGIPIVGVISGIVASFMGALNAVEDDTSYKLRFKAEEQLQKSGLVLTIDEVKVHKDEIYVYTNDYRKFHLVIKSVDDFRFNEIANENLSRITLLGKDKNTKGH